MRGVQDEDRAGRRVGKCISREEGDRKRGGVAQGKDRENSAGAK